MPDSTTLATVLFTDIVGSTEIAADMGDRRWQELLRRHHAMVRQELRRSGGREIDTAGDGFFATFPRPAAAIRCAWAIGDRLRELGVEVRAGVHTGEVEVRGRSVGGIAVHIGSRVAGTAGPGEIVVTSTVRDLVSGSGFDFEHRGIQPLKGVPGTWPLFAVTGAEGKQRPAPPKAEVARERRQAIEAPSVVRRRPWLGGIAAALVVALVVAVLALGDEDAPPTPTGIQPGTAVQVDPETGKVLATVTGLPGTTGPSPGPIAVGEGGVWVYIYPHLIHVDPLHHSIEAIIPSGFATTVEVGFHQIWLASTRHKGITRINPADNESLPPIDLRFPASDTPSASDNATGMAVGEGAVWETWGSGHLIRVDPRQGRVERINLDANLYGVAAGEGSVWVGDQLSGSIIPVDPRSHEPRQPIDLFGNIDAIAAGEGQVWVLDRGASTVTPIDVSVGRPEPPIDVGDNPTDMDIGLGFLWVSDESGTITRIDALTHHKEEFDFGTPIASIAVDLDTGSLWALASEHMPVF